MVGVTIVLGILALSTHVYSSDLSIRADDVTLSLEPQVTGGFLLALIKGEDKTVYGHIGRTLVSTFTTEDVEGGVEVHIGNVNLTVQTLYDNVYQARGIKIKWNSFTPNRFEDCLDFGDNHWYGGPMQVDQIYPIEQAQQTYSPYISKEQDNGAIVERYWLNSAGEYIYVHPQVPLFVDYNNISPNHICFGAQIANPYSSRRNRTELSYDFWILSDVRTAHKHAVKTYLGQPTGVPDFRMVQHPIWSTWAQYSQDVDGAKVLEFAGQIKAYGFNNSQLEVDDLWEICYGSLTIDENKFPNFTDTVQELKNQGYRVTIWVHPFINSDCEPWYSEALSNGYLLLDESGSPATSWWNNNGSSPGFVDFTKPAATEWWSGRVRSLLDKFGIDSVKFDGGESSFTPQVAVQNGDIDLQPHNVVQQYARVCATFGDMVEVRAGFMTQDLPIFVRMVDRDSIWGLNNGLPTLLTTTFQMNLNGYTLVLPDMIGGNGYNLNHEQADLPAKELLIRWVQANTFLPTMQFSFAPWNFDDETVEISRKYANLHAEYAEHIYAAMQASVDEGAPVNPPLWWIAPNDEDALAIWDEYLLGEDILVAPVLEDGARSRDIYLPAGTWFEEGDDERVLTGPIWLRDYPAPLDTLPYFVREGGQVDSSTTMSSAAAALILIGLLVNVMNHL